MKRIKPHTAPKHQHNIYVRPCLQLLAVTQLIKMFRSKKCSRKNFVEIAAVALAFTATFELVVSFPSTLLTPAVAESYSLSPPFPLPESLPSRLIPKVDGYGPESIRGIKETLGERFQQKFPRTKDPVVTQSPSPSPSFPIPKSLPSGGTLKVDGSSSMTVINEALGQRFQQKFPGTKVELASGGTDRALAALVRGDINIAAVGRPLTEGEKDQGLVAIPISRDKIAIIVGSDNPFKKSLTFDQFAKMFRGEITNWSQVRGAPGKIRFLDHPEFSDTRRSLSTYAVFKQAPFQTGSNTTLVSQDDTATIVRDLGKDGISYAIADQVLNLPNVRVIPMHKTMPNDPRYPYSQPRSYVYRKQTATPAILAFLGFATSAPGQEILAAAKQQEAQVVRQSLTSGSSSGTSVGATSSSHSPASSNKVALVPTSTTEQGFPWWFLLLAAIPLLGLLWWLLKQRRDTRSGINNEIHNLAANITEINNKIDDLRNDWERNFIPLATRHADELINTIGSRDTFHRVIHQKIVDNNTDIVQHINQQINHTYDQKIQNFIPVITQDIVNKNQELKQYFDQRLQHSVNNNTKVNNQIVNLSANITEMNNQIENLRRDWERTFITLMTQHIDELINTIANRDTFHRVIHQKIVNSNTDIMQYMNQQIDNTCDQKMQDLYITELIKTKNELTLIINNANTQLYEWTLGELMAIKGCLTDRQVLVEQLVTFSTELRTKLDDTLCVDINTFKRFKP